MYTSSARWYDALYSFKEYQKETDDIVALLRKVHPKAKTILDVACGTAEHARNLSKIYAVDGIDLSEEFVRIAQEKNPSGQYFCADMINFDLDKKYDVILCLFSSIGYVKSLENVVAALVSFRKHLCADGVVLVEPWFTPETWKPGLVQLLTAESDAGKICRMSSAEREGILSVLNFHYLIGTSDGVQHISERHELGMFLVQEMTEAFTKAGLSVEYDEKKMYYI